MQEVLLMANPRSRWSSARTGAKRAHWKLELPNIVKCPQCHAYKLPHRVCKECGFYKGKEVIKMEVDKKSKSK
jgi:large subunit ribosomal protein L32